MDTTMDALIAACDEVERCIAATQAACRVALEALRAVRDELSVAEPAS